MILFEDVLNAYINFRKGGRKLSTKERDALWRYVNNYVVGLSKRLFKKPLLGCLATRGLATPDSGSNCFIDYRWCNRLHSISHPSAAVLIVS